MIFANDTTALPLVRKCASGTNLEPAFLLPGAWGIPYSLDQTPRLLFISSPEFVRRLFESGDYSRVAFINTSSFQRGNP